MSNNTIDSEKKKALLAHKEKILEEIKYYEKRIEDEQSKCKIEYYVDDASSDSDDDLCLTMDQGPTLMQLKLEQSKLRTCLQATHELTSLQILQSEVNVIVNDPVFEGEPPVKEPGTWREVTAECRIDLVPFSIAFYCHKSNAKFGAASYRGLNVMLVKAAHEAELSVSVLPTLVRPSDALEVIRSYAVAYRSRRSTLARLASKYADSLFMEPLAEGGYLLKCANLLQVAWRLENKWSPLAPFHHRMKFDLEYMEETYINTITQCHKQLSDPTISTDERTLLLSKIIATCLEASPVSESAESDQDARLPKRRATLDQEIEEPENKKKKEVMAPPKSLPKKAKATKSMSESTRPNNNSTRNREMRNNNTEGDKENEHNLMRNTESVPAKNVNSRESVPTGSKSGQKTAEKSSKTIISSKIVKTTSGKNLETIVSDTDPKNKNKKPNSAPQSKVTEKENDKLPTTKKSVVKDKSKKVPDNNKAATESNNNPSNDDVATKNNKANDKIDTAGDRKKQDIVNKNSAPQESKTSAKRNNKAPEKSPEGSIKKTVDENTTSATRSNVAKEPIKSIKKLNKENPNTNKAKTIQSNGKGENTVTKPTEKALNAGSAHKTVEKNANNKIKDKIVDIAKKTTKQSVDNVIEKNTIKRVLHSSNDPVISQPIPDLDDIVPAKTKKSTNIDKVMDKNSKVKNNIITNKLTDNNNRQQLAGKSDAANKMKNTNVEKVSRESYKNIIVDDKTEKFTNKKNEVSDKKKITNTNATNVTGKDKLNQKSKSQNYENIRKSDLTKKPVMPLRMQNNFKMSHKSIGDIKASAAKENGGKVKSKIPQKKLSPLNENILKKNPLRMSPRHISSTFNSTSSLVKQSIQKSTNIPRLTKPMFKVK